MPGEAPVQMTPPAGWRDADADAPLMVPLPAGEFFMGENLNDKFANDTERPAHRVGFENDFALGKFPVTVREFQKFCPQHSPGEAGDLPVVRVSWIEAFDYCHWLTEQTRRLYRLPSEAEWEFACRAGSPTPFAGGFEISAAEANFLFDEYGGRLGPGCRTRVGNYSANAFGLHDLQGNVNEWVADSWHPNYLGAPWDGSAWLEPDRRQHVIRGGAWDYLPRLLRSSWRDWRSADCRADNLGFRVATSDLRNSTAL